MSHKQWLKRELASIRAALVELGNAQNREFNWERFQLLCHREYTFQARADRICALLSKADAPKAM